MTMKSGRTPPLAAADAKLLHDSVHRIVADYAGPAGDLEAALGMLLLGRYLGWRALYVIHSKKTVKKYEKILGMKVQEALEPDGPDAERSVGYRAACTRPSFWKVVSGEDPIERVKRQSISRGNIRSL